MEFFHFMQGFLTSALYGFYSTKNNLRKFDTIEQFIKELKVYMEYYNNKRIKSKLKGLSPVQYRIHSSRVA